VIHQTHFIDYTDKSVGLMNQAPTIISVKQKRYVEGIYSGKKGQA
jgi:hypothetical protein